MWPPEMGFVGGPVGGLLVAAVLVVAVVLWLRRDRQHPGPRIHGEEGIDREALEEAEREVRDLPRHPDEDRPGDDWGPGAPGGNRLVPRGPAA
jgi:hypothetical protein